VDVEEGQIVTLHLEGGFKLQIIPILTVQINSIASPPRGGQSSAQSTATGPSNAQVSSPKLQAATTAGTTSPRKKVWMRSTDIIPLPKLAFEPLTFVEKEVTSERTAHISSHTNANANAKEAVFLMQSNSSSSAALVNARSSSVISPETTSTIALKSPDSADSHASSHSSNSVLSAPAVANNRRASTGSSVVLQPSVLQRLAPISEGLTIATSGSTSVGSNASNNTTANNNNNNSIMSVDELLSNLDSIAPTVPVPVITSSDGEERPLFKELSDEEVGF
jgi:hypothetical protein